MTDRISGTVLSDDTDHHTGTPTPDLAGRFAVGHFGARYFSGWFFSAAYWSRLTSISATATDRFTAAAGGTATDRF